MYSKSSIPILSYRFCLITSNMSNTRFHYTSVFAFLKKNTDNSDLNISFLPPLGSLLKPRQCPEFQTDSGKTHKLVMISYHRPFCSEEEARALEEVLHRWCPDENTPYTPLLLLAAIKESPSARQQCSIRMKTLRQARWPWSRIRLRNRPRQLLLLSRTRYQEKALSFRIRTGSGKPKTRRTNPWGAGALLIFTDSEALSQQLACCDRLITMTDILR